MNFDDLLGINRAEQLRGPILGAITDAYTENCGRFSDELGDNNLTFAVCVVHNLRHLLEEALEAEPGVTTSRPRNSFQIEIDGTLVLHFYKGGSGADAVGEMRFDESQTKLDLVNENAQQLSLIFDDEIPEDAHRRVRHLVVVHTGTPADGLRSVHIGAPYLSPVNGLSWIWLEPLDGRETTSVGEPVVPHVHGTAPWLDESALPELIVELRQPAEESSETNTAS